MHLDFSNRRTVSPGKLESDAHILRQLQRRKVDLKNTVVVTLIGNARELPRHYKLYKPFFKYIIGVERDKKTALGCIRSIKRRGYNKIKVIEGDFFTVVRELHRQGVKIGFLDFDGVQTIGVNEEKLQALIKLVNPVFTLNIGAARKQHSQFKDWCKHNGKNRTQHIVGQVAYSLKRLGQEYIDSIFTSTQNQFSIYVGVSNMFRILSERV